MMKDASVKTLRDAAHELNNLCATILGFAIYAWAQEPKRLVLYAEAGHSLHQCQAELYDLLTEWIPEHTGAAEGSA